MAAAPSLIPGDPAFCQAVIDALPERMVVLDAAGGIIAANSTWLEAARTAGVEDPVAGVGGDYFAICRALGARGDRVEARLRDGIRSVAWGQLECFEFEFACWRQDDRRTLQLLARPLRLPTHPRPLGAVASHLDITRRALAEERTEQLFKEIAAAQAALGRLRQVVATCACCSRVRSGDGRWALQADLLREVTGEAVPAEVCPTCEHGEAKAAAPRASG